MFNLKKSAALLVFSSMSLLQACGDSSHENPNNLTSIEKVNTESGAISGNCKLAKPLKVPKVDLTKYEMVFKDVKTDLLITDDLYDYAKTFHLFQIFPSGSLGGALESVDNRWLGFAHEYLGNMSIESSRSDQNGLSYITTLDRSELSPMALTVFGKEDAIFGVELTVKGKKICIRGMSYQGTRETYYFPK